VAIGDRLEARYQVLKIDRAHAEVVRKQGESFVWRCLHSCWRNIRAQGYPRSCNELARWKNYEVPQVAAQIVATNGMIRSLPDGRFVPPVRI
jgi:hypothetical protein